MPHGGSGFSPLRTTSGFHHVGYSYAFMCWGAFAVYCIMVQIDRFLLYRARQKRIASNGAIQYKPFSVFSIFSPFAKIGEYNVKIPFVTNLIKLKHIVGMFFFCAINVVWIIAAPFTLAEGRTFTVQSIGLVDRRAAFVGMVNWSFVFVLGSRNNIVSRMSGLSFEELIPFHRWIARVGLAEYIPHFIWRIIVGYRRNFSVRESLFRNLEQGTGTVAMIGFLLLFVTSFEFIRRNYFEIFYYTHILGIFVAIIATCMHEVSCFYYFIPTVLLWFFDRCWRSYQSWMLKSKLIQIDAVARKTDADSKSAAGMVRVLFEYEGLRTYKPGQYVFLAIVNKTRKAYKSYMDWHPMTLSEVFRSTAAPPGKEVINLNNKMVESKLANKSGDTSEAGSSGNSSENDIISSLRRRTQDQNMGTVHIKSLGKYTSNLLAGAAANDEFHLRVDGPYGPRIEYQDYKIMAAFAAGVGVTPALSLIKDCIERRSAGVQTVLTEHVYLIWAIRTLELPGVSITYGVRPNIKECMDHIQAKSNNDHVMVHTCGSDDFMRTVLNEALKRHWASHRETFEF
ncbi:ferric reductase like transmembrane component-domain-containing protein [Dichotomocladium elegans]|nr:ferric reductase like transmembrane component-domain-containing protein [Dichotomocladium elegans]